MRPYLHMGHNYTGEETSRVRVPRSSRQCSSTASKIDLFFPGRSWGFRDSGIDMAVLVRTASTRTAFPTVRSTCPTPVSLAFRPWPARNVMADVVIAWPGMAYVVMAYVVMAYLGMAYVVMAYVVMDHVVMACLGMACLGMACLVMACLVMAYIVMAYIVMAAADGRFL